MYLSFYVVHQIQCISSLAYLCRHVEKTNAQFYLEYFNYEMSPVQAWPYV